MPKVTTNTAPSPAPAVAAAPAPGSEKPAPKPAATPAAPTKPAPRRAAAPVPAPGAAPADFNAALQQATRSLLEDSITLDAEEPVAPPAAVPKPEPAAAAAQEEAAQEPAAAEAPAEETAPEEEAPEIANTGDDPEPDAEAEPDADEAALAEEAASNAWPKSATKRLTKLLKERTALKAQLEGAAQLREERDALKAKLEEAPQQQEQAPRTITAAERQLQQEIAVTEQWLETIEAHPEGLTLTDAQGKEVTYGPEQLRKARTRFIRQLTTAEIRLQQHQAELARQTAEHSRAAIEQHPFLKQKSSPEYQMIQQVLRAFPEVARIPDHLSVLADAIAWRQQQAAKAKAAATKPAAPAKPAPPARPGKPAALPAAVNPESAARQQRTSDFLKTGNPESAAATILDLVES